MKNNHTAERLAMLVTMIDEIMTDHRYNPEKMSIALNKITKLINVYKVQLQDINPAIYKLRKFVPVENQRTIKYDVQHEYYWSLDLAKEAAKDLTCDFDIIRQDAQGHQRLVAKSYEGTNIFA